MNKAFWQNCQAVIVVHEATTGLVYDLRDYLLKQGVEKLLFISHPLIYLKDNLKKSSRYELYKAGKLIKTKTAFHWVLPEPLLYLKDFFYTIYWCLTVSRKCDIFLGINNLNAFSGCLLKFLRRVDRVIYYVIDYIPQRFSNRVLNEIYHQIEKFSAQYSDWTWNLSPRMIEARRKKWQINFPHQLVVPHGIHFARIKRLSFNEVDKQEILYMGTIFKKQGIQLVIEALPEIVKKIPQIKFCLIGKGPYEQELKQLVHKLNLKQQVEFLGYIPDHRQVENRIASAAVGLAMYEGLRRNFVYYTDPGKVINYLGAGVPVFITNVPYIAKVIERAGCGIIVPYKKEKFAEELIRFLLDEEKMKSYRLNALKFAQKYDWDKIFFQALSPEFKR